MSSSRLITPGRIRTSDRRIRNPGKSLEGQGEKRDFDATGPDDVSPVEPDLAKINAAWPMLAEPLKRAVLALIESASR